MANYYFRNTPSSLWGAGLNWSLTDGGPSVGIVPGAGDNVFFTNNSGPCNVDATTRTCLSVNFSSYTNTITFSQPLEVNGNITLGSGMTLAGSSTLRYVADTYTAATLTSNGKVCNVKCELGKRTVSGVPVTVTLADDWTFTDTLTSGNISNAVVSLNGNTVNFKGGTLAGTGSFGGTTNFLINGSGTTNITIGLLECNTTINHTGNVIFGSSFTFRNNRTLTYLSGNVTPPTTLNLGSLLATTTLDTSGITWNNVTTTSVGTHTIALLSDLKMSGALTLRGFPTLSGSSIYVGGNLTTSSLTTQTAGNSNIILNGTGTWTNSNTIPIGNNIIIDTAGTITVAGNVYYNAGTITHINGNVVTTGSTLTLGTATASSGTLNTSGMSWNNVTFQGPPAANFTLLSDLNVLGNLVTIGTINGVYNINAFKSYTINTTYGGITVIMKGTGTLSNSALNYCFVNVTIDTTGTITIGSEFNFYQGTLRYITGTTVTTSSTLNLRQSSAKNINTNGIEWNNVTIDGSGKPNFTSTFTCKNLNVGSGSFVQLNGSDVFVKGNLTNNTTSTSVTTDGTSTVYLIGNGTWSDTSLGYINFDLVIAPTGTTTISGNVKYSLGSLTFSSGTIVSSGGTLTLGSSNTVNTFVNNQISGLNISNVVLNGNTSFDGTENISITNLSSSNASTTRTINFSTGNTITVTSGLTLAGTATTPILFKSSTIGTKAKFTYQRNNYSLQDVGYTNATDIDSSDGLPIWSYRATLSNTNNWKILAAPPTIAATL